LKASEPDLDLRLVRYFVAVAEHGHFGRAAEALHVTQPSLSRQVRRLEREIGAVLLERIPQGCRLTEAGAAFLPPAKALLHAATEASAMARAAARPHRVTIGYATNLVVTPAVRELRRRHPDAEVSTLHLAWNEARDALLEHRVDIAVTRLPLRTDRLHVTPLHEEPRVLLVAAGHRVAGTRSATLADIADEPMLRSTDPEWDAFWRVDPRPDGRPAPDGPLPGGAAADRFEAVAEGRAVAIVPASTWGPVQRPDLTTVPLRDVAPGQTVLVTRAGEQNPLVARFGAIAVDVLVPPGSAEVTGSER